MTPTTPVDPATDELLLKVVDLTWGHAMEDGSVPSTKIAEQIIERARAALSPTAAPDDVERARRVVWPGATWCETSTIVSRVASTFAQDRAEHEKAMAVLADQGAGYLRELALANELRSQLTAALASATAPPSDAEIERVAKFMNEHTSIVLPLESFKGLARAALTAYSAGRGGGG